MTYHLEWAVPGRVVLLTFSGHILLEEVTDLIAEAEPMTHSGQAPVHYIVQMDGVQTYPTSLRQLGSVTKTDTNHLIGWWVVVGAGPVVSFSLNVLANLLRVKAKTAASTNEALALLRRVDLTLLNEEVA